MMSCRELRPFWPMYLDGELGEQDAAPYLEHLSSCPACHGVVEGERRFRQVFRSKVAGKDQVPAALRARVEGLAKEGSRNPLRMVTATAALACLMLFTWTTQTGFVPVLVNVAQKHKESLPLDVRTADPEVAQQFVDQHLPKVRVPKVAAEGVKLSGARVVDLPGHRGEVLRGVIFRYTVGNGDQPVSLVVYKSNPNEQLQMARAVRVGDQQVFVDRVGDLQAAVWQQRDLIYSLVGGLEEQQMLKLVSATDHAE